VADSDANFVLFGLFPDRHEVWNGLLERGVLIREVGPEGWLRVSVGTPQETAAFRAALEEVLGW
jgi:histidinol-phosphate aminotransferase